jgi:hypothetical protein
MRCALWTAAVSLPVFLFSFSTHGQDENPLPENMVEVEEVVLTTGVNAVFTMEFEGSPFGQTFMMTPIEMPPETTTLVQTREIQDELELVEDQRKKLMAQIGSLTTAYQKKHDRLSKDSETIDVDELEKLHRDFVADVKETINEILLPFQQERLEQIRLQAELRVHGSAALESGAFADFLKLSDKQEKELHVKTEEMAKKLEQEIKTLRQKRQREVLEDVLTKDQLKALDERLGSPLADEVR